MGDSAELWCWMSREEAKTYLETTNTTWPFSRVTIGDFYSLAEEKTSLINKLLYAVDCIGISISISGILLTPFLLCTLRNKAFKEKNAFFASMFFIACLDLVYCIMTCVYHIWYPKLVLEGSTSYTASWIMVWVSSMPYFFSLASELVALALTVERYVSVGRPQLYTTTSTKTKHTIRLCVIGGIFLLSAAKLHFTFTSDVVLVGDIYHITITDDSPFWAAAGTFSDMVLPFILLIVTPIVSAKFRACALKHMNKSIQKAQAKCANPTRECWTTFEQQQRSSAGQSSRRTSRVNTEANEKIKEWRSMLTLTLILDTMLVLTQLGNCCFCISELICAMYAVSYDSSYNNLWWWWMGISTEVCLDIPLNTLEISSHAFNFLIYIALSSAMRSEFTSVMMKFKRLRSKK